MARRRNSARHHRRGRFAFLYKVLSVLVICAAIIAAVTLFFRVEHIKPTGQQRYTEEQIREASGVLLGDNLFLLNKYDVAGRIIDQLPYVENIRINRTYPNTLNIEVAECAKPFAIEQNGEVWLVSTRGKIVDQVAPSEGNGYAVISGCELLEPAVGTRIALATEYGIQEESLLALLAALQEGGMLEKVDGIRLGDLSTLYLDYSGRFTVKLPYGADYDFKMMALRAYLAEDAIQDNMTGTFDMQTDEDETYFNPNVR